MTLSLSPSKLEVFDDTTPFGCEMKWWHEHASAGPKIKPPENESFAIGNALHKEIEDYITTKKPYADPSRLFLAGVDVIRDILSEGIGPVEQWIKFELGGVPFRGRMDLLIGSPKLRGVLDWKTTSDIKKYAKTTAQLRNNHQMVLYAYDLVTRGLVDSPVAIEHVYFQTKGKETVERVQSSISGKQIKAHIDNVVLPLVARIKIADTETDVNKLKASTSKCFRCPHKEYCPKGVMPMASFMDRFKAVQAQTLAPAPQPILPPDAAKSNPALAADPVEGFSPPPAPAPTVTAPGRGKRKVNYLPIEDVTPTAPVVPAVPAPTAPMVVEEPKRGPGRPLGAKNLPKDPDLETVASGFNITEVSFDQGVTVNLGDFQHARFDVGMKAQCNNQSQVGALTELKRLVTLELEALVKTCQPAKK